VGHRELLERDAVDVLQPDVHRCGGLTELRRIADMAGAHGLPVVPHTGTNPTLHFIAATGNAPMAEHITVPVWYESSEDTYADAIYANPPVPEDGSIPLPDGPGVSAELNRGALERFTVS
jgi:L-alanine-DL-glutamate epimerase-like enolase superfamily enzyme